MQLDYAKEEEKITGEFGNDPLVKLKGKRIRLKSRRKC